MITVGGAVVFGSILICKLAEISCVSREFCGKILGSDRITGTLDNRYVDKNAITSMINIFHLCLSNPSI